MEFANCNASLRFASLKIDPQFTKELHHDLRALSTRRHQRSAGSETSHSHPIEPIPAGIANGRCGAFADAPPIFLIDNLWWPVSITV